MLASAPPEIELVCRCARTRRDGETANRIEALSKRELDWEMVQNVARQNGVAPLLYESLTAIDDSGVPNDVLDSLRSHYRANTARNMFLDKQLLDILSAFEDASVRALPFKGPVVARRAYGEIGLREFADLDLLVRSSDLPRARDILQSRGYRLEIETPIHTDEELRTADGVIPPPKEFKFYREPKTVIELQTGLGTVHQPFSSDFDALWERRSTVRLAGEPVPVLAEADRVLMLACHGSRHRWQRLEWVCDLAEVCSRNDVDWSSVWDGARQHNCRTELLLGLRLVSELLDADLPDGALERSETTRDERFRRTLASDLTKATLLGLLVWVARGRGAPSEAMLRIARSDSSIGSLADAVGENFVADPIPGQLESPGQISLAFAVQTSDDTSDALSRTFRKLFVPRPAEYEFLPLPKPLHPVYYLVRPMRTLLAR